MSEPRRIGPIVREEADRLQRLIDEGCFQWTTHESVKRSIESALSWLYRCESEDTTAYVHDAIGDLVFLSQELDYLARKDAA